MESVCKTIYALIKMLAPTSSRALAIQVYKACTTQLFCSQNNAAPDVTENENITLDKIPTPVVMIVHPLVYTMQLNKVSASKEKGELRGFKEAKIINVYLWFSVAYACHLTHWGI